MSKSIKSWLETIGDDYIRNAALANHEQFLKTQPSVTEAESLSEAILIGFVHADTKEGIDYWNGIEEQAFNGTLPVIMATNA